MKDLRAAQAVWAAHAAEPESYIYRDEIVLNAERHTFVRKKGAMLRGNFIGPHWYCSHEHETHEDVAFCTQTPSSGDGLFVQPRDTLRPLDVASWYVSGPWLSIAKEEVEEWRRLNSLSIDRLYNKIASDIAIGFAERRFSFTFCDCVINDLWGLMTSEYPCDPDWTLPEPFWTIYLAFDAGEGHPDPNIDPIEAFTRPQITKVVANLRGG